MQLINFHSIFVSLEMVFSVKRALPEFVLSNICGIELELILAYISALRHVQTSKIVFFFGSISSVIVQSSELI